MTDEDDDDQWLDAAGAILDGQPVAWDELRKPAAADSASIRAMQLIAEIAKVHQGNAGLGQWGPFPLIEKIGHGTFGDVYRAHDPELDRDVALKLIDTHRASLSLDEGKLLARVRHPNVVTVHGAGVHDGSYGIWMELIHGRTLAAIVRETGPLPWTDVAQVGCDVCAALIAVHACGLVHGDVKAQNVMREDGGRIVLMDFGTGRLSSDAAAGLAGTPLYLAPEVLAGAAPDERADVYSAGVLLYYLLTGAYPIEGRTLDEIRASRKEGRGTAVRERHRRCPRALADVIDRATGADPRSRFASAADFDAALRRALTQRARRVARRLSWSAAALIVVGTVGLGWRLRLNTKAGADITFGARDWALITTFDNRTGDSSLDQTIEHALEYQLANSSYLNVVPSERIEDALRLMARPTSAPIDAATGREIALRDGAIKVVIGGAIDRVGYGYAMTAQVLDPRDGTVLASEREEAASREDIQGAVRRLSLWVRSTVGESPVSIKHDVEQLEHATTPSLQAVRLFSEGLRAFNQFNLQEAQTLLRAALAADPEFASAHIWLAWTLMNLHEPRDVYLASVNRARELAGSTSEREREWILGSYYTLTYQNDRALGQFEAMVGRFPDDYWALHNLRVVYNRLGRHADIAGIERRTADLRPNDFRVQAEAASWIMQIAGIQAAGPLIDRARRLMPAAGAPDVNTASAVAWIELYPVHEAWMRGDARNAARLLDIAVAKPQSADDPTGAAGMLVGKLRLALGQVRLAEQAFTRIPRPALRSVLLAAVSWARRDTADLVAKIGSYQSNDLSAVSLLIRGGLFERAEKLLDSIPKEVPLASQWSAEEIREARGDVDLTAEAMKRGAPWLEQLVGARCFYYSETLARAAAKSGDLVGAIRLLEKTAALGDRAYVISTQSGFEWMQVERLLADLYREDGQIDKARAIERDLLARLAAADPDYPLLVELKQRAGK